MGRGSGFGRHNGCDRAEDASLAALPMEVIPLNAHTKAPGPKGPGAFTVQATTLLRACDRSGFEFVLEFGPIFGEQSLEK